MKNKQLFYLGLMGTLTPLSILIWIWRVIDVQALNSLVPQPIKLLTFIGGILISLAFMILTIYFVIKSRKECQVCGMEMERQIIQVEKLATVGQLAGGVAHEVNTPASIIVGRIEAMLLDPVHLSERDRGDLSVIKNQAERISQITQGLLLFAKRAPAEKVRVDLNEIVRESLVLVETQFRKAKIAVVRDIANQPIIFFGNHNQLIQVVLNLLTNARDSMPNGGTIQVRTAIVNGKINKSVARAAKSVGLLEIIDTGCGVSPENMEKLFTPFFTTKKTGTGLGLSVAYGIVQEHGGNIEFESKMNEGSTFSIRIPLGNHI